MCLSNAKAGKAKSTVITRIHSTGIIVSDQDAALKWYTEVLGWKVAIDQMMGPDSRFLTVEPAPGATQLVLGTPNILGDKDGVGAGISFIADDVDKTYEELLAKGVTFTMVPEDMPWGGRGASFTDPDGNSFFVSTD